MTARYTETQIIAAVSRLTPKRLTRFVKAEFVVPIQTEGGPRFRDIDFARLELLCELSDDLEMNEETVSVVISLIDQLHAVRDDLRRVLSAVRAQPDDVRQNIARAMIAGGNKRDV